MTKFNLIMCKDLMLELEEFHGHGWNMILCMDVSKKYKVIDLYQCACLLEQYGFIQLVKLCPGEEPSENFAVQALTMSGQEMLNDIRDNNCFKILWFYIKFYKKAIIFVLGVLVSLSSLVSCCLNLLTFFEKIKS